MLCVDQLYSRLCPVLKGGEGLSGSSKSLQKAVSATHLNKE